MLISTEISSFMRYGTNEQVLKMLKDVGFEAYDFSMFLEMPTCFLYDDDYLAKAQQLRAVADSIGIVCNQMHAPFPTLLPDNPQYAQGLFDNIASASGIKHTYGPGEDKWYNEFLHKLIVRSLEIGRVLGAKICVVHPFNDFDANENAQMYHGFEANARQFGMKIALENMWNWKKDAPTASAAACSHHDDFVKHLSLLDKDVFVACLDIGHAEMEGLNTSSVEMINALGDRLQCLHLHDNNMHDDLHELPYTNKVDFDSICKALATSGYSGDITLEAPSFPKRFDKEFLPTVAKHMYDVAGYIRHKILQYRQG